jgi:microcystin-dependent protein
MDAFCGEIRPFAFSFAPLNWAQCNGQQISSDQAAMLYAVIGNLFGGTGPNQFNLPNLQGAAVCREGQGSGLSPRVLGQRAGQSAVTLSLIHLPTHTHMLNAVQPPVAQLTNAPAPPSYLARTVGQFDYTNSDNPDSQMNPHMINVVGGNQPHENRQPFLPVNFCICVNGFYPNQ